MQKTSSKNYKVKTIHVFEKQAKKLIKKYASLKEELSELIKALKENPIQGTPIGKNCYKLRIAISSKGKGKSGGARLITNLAVHGIYRLAIGEGLRWISGNKKAPKKAKTHNFGAANFHTSVSKRIVFQLPKLSTREIFINRCRSITPIHSV